MPEANMKEILAASEGRLSDEKISRLGRTLANATGCELTEIVVHDPMILRRAMIRYLKGRSVSPGNLQHLEQAFMGAIRRAAIVGLLPAPPEGPWTREWQLVLDFDYKSPGYSRSRMRSLAAWATDRDCSPLEIEESDLVEFASATGSKASAISSLVELLAEFSQASSKLHKASNLDERLQSKAQRGTVRT